MELHRTVQLHPSLLCNLACRHCYSLSGPRRRGALPQGLVLDLVVDARAEGYTALSVSGGEPLLWPGLLETLALARRLGMATALTTNAMPLTPRRAAELAGVLDLAAVSLDGAPASHDRMRGRAGAFQAMRARLPLLRANGVPFGFIFTLTRDNLDELPWVASFALEQGARLLQIHPLEEVGRAAAALPGKRPDELGANACYLAALRLRDRLAGRLEVQLDLAHRGLVREEPWRVLGPPPGAGAGRLADHLGDLIVEEDGWAVPIQYGFPREHALGSLHDARLPRLAERWRSSGGPERLRARCGEVLDAATADPDALPAFNWYEALSAAPARSAAPAP